MKVKDLWRPYEPKSPFTNEYSLANRHDLMSPEEEEQQAASERLKGAIERIEREEEAEGAMFSKSIENEALS